MVAKRLRLPRVASMAQASHLSSALLSLRYRPNQLGYNRFAVIISTRSAKTAVRRHFWKRLVLEVVRHWAQHSYDFLIIFPGHPIVAPPSQIRAELSRLINKVFAN